MLYLNQLTWCSEHLSKGYYPHFTNEETHQRVGLLARGQTAGRRQKLNLNPCHYHLSTLLFPVGCGMRIYGDWPHWYSWTYLLLGPWWTRHEERPSLVVYIQPGDTMFRPQSRGLNDENKWMGQNNLIPYWEKKAQSGNSASQQVP